MRTITVCIGSGCHLKGSYQIIETLKRLIKDAGVDAEVRLAASFCQGRCTEGVVIKIDDTTITRVSPDNIAEIFEAMVADMGRTCDDHHFYEQSQVP